MYNAWVLNLRAEPPSVTLQLKAKDDFQLKRAVQSIIDGGYFPGENGYTVVTECEAKPLGIKEPS